jgi:hypothetical protein
MPGTPPPPSGNSYNCVTVRVYRNGEFASTPLPTFFARLFDVVDQGVRAEAMATAVAANGTNCMWPLAIPDRWAAWSATDRFVKYGEFPNPPESELADEYDPPTLTDNGTGFQLDQSTLSALDASDRLILRQFSPEEFTSTVPNFGISASEFVAIVPEEGGFATSLTCSDPPAYISREEDQPLVPYTDANAATDAATEASTRILRDPSAQWVYVPGVLAFRVQDSCAGTPPCGVVSPRLVALPLFDVERFEDTRRTGNPEIEIVNFVGFFIADADPASGSIEGYLTTIPGIVDTSEPQVHHFSAFLRTVALLR